MIPKLYFVVILLSMCLDFIMTARVVVKENINICENVADHIFLQNIEDCRKYYVCVDGQPKAQQCTSGLYFDAKRQACIASQQNCLKCPSRQMLNLPLIKTCDKYIFCYYGQASLMKCEKNQQFNVKTGKCDWARNVDCVENHCSIHTINNELIYVPSAASCEKYYLCMSGQAKALTCAAGLHFSMRCNCCDRAENVKCAIEDTENTLENNKEKRYFNYNSQQLHTSTLIGETNTITCPTNGIFVYQYIEDSEKYITCNEGKANLYTCAAGYQFDDRLKRCVNKDNDQHINIDKLTTELELIQCSEFGAAILPHNQSSKYILCVNGNATVYDCPEDHYFDAEDNHCHGEWELQRKKELSRYGAVVNEVAGIVCPKYATFTFPHVENDKFYLCLDGKATVFACAEGQYFDINEHGCVSKPIELGLNEDDEFTNLDEDKLTTTKRLADSQFELTSSPISVKCPSTGNTTLPHVLRNQYYICREGIAAVFTCPEGLLYDTKLKTCTEPSSNNEVYSPALGSDATNIMCPKFGTFKFPHLNKTMYYLCTDGKTYILACGVNEIFDADINICREDETLLEQTVTNTMSTENAIQTLTAVATEIASNIICPKFGTFIYPHAQRNRYYVCIDGNAIGFICAEGQYFDTKTNACQWVSEVNESEEEQRPMVLDEPVNIVCPSVGAMKFSHEEKHKFYLCVHGMASVLACANGSFFEAETGACRRTFELNRNETVGDTENITNIENGILNTATGSAVTCPLSGTFMYPHAEINQYYVCLNGKALVLSCPEGLVFNTKEKICRAPVQSENVEIAPPKVLDEIVNIICPATGAYKYPHVEKHKFYLCINGMGSVMECPGNSIFDKETGSCLRKEATNLNTTLESNETETTPNSSVKTAETINITCPELGTFLYPHNEKHKYFICLDGTSIEFTCAKGLIFDVIKNVCVEDTAVENQNIKCPAQGTDMLAHKESNKFYLCIKGIAIIQSCAAGDFFDSETKTCREINSIQTSLQQTIDVKCPLHGTSKLAHVDQNKFYLCIDGLATTHSCAKGDYYDAESETCRESPQASILPIENKTEQISSGENTLTEPAKTLCPPHGTTMIAHVDSNKFYQCVDGIATLQNCAPGDFFDVEIQTCREAFNNVMTIIECPELGTFVYPLPQKNTFYVCTDGKARTVYCAKGDIFDTELNACHEVNIESPIIAPKKEIVEVGVNIVSDNILNNSQENFELHEEFPDFREEYKNDEIKNEESSNAVKDAAVMKDDKILDNFESKSELKPSASEMLTAEYLQEKFKESQNLKDEMHFEPKESHLKENDSEDIKNEEFNTLTTDAVQVGDGKEE